MIEELLEHVKPALALLFALSAIHATLTNPSGWFVEIFRFMAFIISTSYVIVQLKKREGE